MKAQDSKNNRRITTSTNCRLRIKVTNNARTPKLAQRDQVHVIGSSCTCMWHKGVLCQEH
jgi:hypothetical protein